MTPQELAERYPKLYHVTTPGAWESIKKLGLLSTSQLLTLFEIDESSRIEIESKRRATEVELQHPQFGKVTLNDNVPLSEQALSQCLDDQLKPMDWMRLLNARVFFWSNEERLNRLLNAKLNRQRTREVIVVDTLSLATAHAERIDLCPINSGTTIRKPARRGLHTFTPLLKYPFEDWRRLRGRLDDVQEVTVRNHVKDIADHTLEILQIPTT
jgi:hypothetical protein